MRGPRVAVWLAALLAAGCADRAGDGPGGGGAAIDPETGGGKTPGAPGPETPREASAAAPGGGEGGGEVGPGGGSAATDPATPGEEDPAPSWDPSWPVGRVYRLDLTTGDLVHPEGAQDVLLPFLAEVAQILVEPVEDHGDAVDLLIAQARDDGGVGQDLCKPTASVTAAWDGTRIDIGPSALVFSVGDVSGVIVDLYAAGEFSEDGSVLGSMSLEGGMDTRAFDCLADPDSCGTGALCGLLAAAGSECGDCGDGGEWLCAYLRVEGLTAVREDGLELRPVTPTEAVANRDVGACG